jgi:hypothetical protein
VKVTTLTLVTAGHGNFKIDGIEKFAAYSLAMHHAYSSYHKYALRSRVMLETEYFPLELGK